MGTKKMTEKAEVTPDPPAANQAMKGIFIRYQLMQRITDISETSISSVMSHRCAEDIV